MMIPTEPIGSIPRPHGLIEGMQSFSAGKISGAELDILYDAALRDTIERFEATGSPVITDGEQTKESFVTYPLQGLENLAPDGIPITFADGHIRHLPRLIGGPFHYRTSADIYLKAAKRYAHVPLKQAVISASALSLLYPQGGVAGYSREEYLGAVVAEQEGEIRRCLQNGAHVVQVDFTEARLSIKLDSSLRLLESFIDLNNLVLERFSEEERRRIGVHTCPGADRDSTHSAEVDYADLLPLLFELNVGRFYVQLGSEADQKRVLSTIRGLLQPGQIVFVGVTDPINPTVETPEQVRDRVLEAAEFIPLRALGTTDDCGFSPFADDTSTSREIAFAKIKNRVEGTKLASEELEA